MGNFEKLVVLTVLFLSAVVLAVSLSGDADYGAKNPLIAAQRALSEEQAGGEAPADASRLALSAEGRPEAGQEPAAGEPKAPAGETAGPGAEAPADPAAGAPPQTNDLGQPRVLRTRQGLAEAPLEGYMVYTAAEGDTWSALAERFYRSATYEPLLLAANEGLARPAAGEPILVPVYDFRAAPKDRAPRGAGPARPASATSKTADAGAGAAPAAGTYTVVDGDNLWKIADKVYGSGARWMEIYEANRNVMGDADSLKIGMTLRIPSKQ